MGRCRRSQRWWQPSLEFFFSSERPVVCSDRPVAWQMFWASFPFRSFFLLCNRTVDSKSLASLSRVKCFSILRCEIKREKTGRKVDNLSTVVAARKRSASSSPFQKLPFSLYYDSGIASWCIMIVTFVSFIAFYTFALSSRDGEE